MSTNTHTNGKRPSCDNNGEVDEEPPESGPTPITLLGGPEIAAPLPELEYLVREIGLVAGSGAPHMLAGYGYSGKTMAAQSMALSLAAGSPVWGAYPCSARRVVHVDLEQGDSLTRRRYQRLARAMGVDLAKLGDSLAVAIMPGGLTLSEACSKRWRTVMRGRDLIIIDSLRAAMPGADENSSDFRAGLDMLGRLSEATRCRPLVIHHARKPNGDDPGAASRSAARRQSTTPSIAPMCRRARSASRSRSSTKRPAATARRSMTSRW